MRTSAHVFGRNVFSAVENFEKMHKNRLVQRYRYLRKNTTILQRLYHRKNPNFDL